MPSFCPASNICVTISFQNNNNNLDRHFIHLVFIMARVKQGATKKTTVKSKKVVSKPEKIPEYHAHKCSTCGARFKRKSDLIIHFRAHSGSKPYQCSECHLSFSVKTNLTRHKRVHSQIKPHKCSECSLSFARKDALNGHLRLHSQTKDFSCPDCPRKFTTASNLREHQQRQHSNDKKYCCSECPRKFALRNFLYSHLKTHGILTPYSCSISTCDQSFRLKRELLLHEASHKKKGDKSTTIKKSSSNKTKSKPKTRVSFKLVSDTEESEDEKSTTKEKGSQVRKGAAVDENENIGNEPPAKKRKIKHTKNGKEEEEEHEFFITSKPYWCFCGQFFTTKDLFAHHQDNEENGKHFLQLHECPLCAEPEVFETFKEFEDHYSSFHQLLIHECPLCEDEYATIQELEDHLDNVNPSLFL